MLLRVLTTACGLGCMTCSASAHCLTCSDSNAEVFLDSCVCKIGYYNLTSVTTSGSCLKCYKDCTSCTDGAICINCVDLNASPLDTVGCSCNSKYYNTTSLTVNGACLPCIGDCSSCISGTTCTTCIDLNSSPALNGCFCNIGFYNSTPLVVNGACLPCLPDCQSCSSENTCNTCIDLNALPASNGCKCKLSYYNLTALFLNGACLSCPSDCRTCDSGLTCLICIDSNAFAAPNGCLCKTGYYNLTSLSFDGACLACKVDCVSCVNENKCLVCADSNAFPTNNGCDCKEGFYNSVDLGVPGCSVCKTGCNCSGKNPCISCIDPKAKVLNSSCSCLAGYYLNSSGYCAACPASCRSCVNLTVCLECSDPNSLLNLGVCQCKEGFYSDSSACKPCDSVCKTCTDSYCLSCFDPLAVPTERTCSCPDGYFINNTNSACVKCDSSCLSCTMSQCLICKHNNAVPIGTTCACPNRYWLDSNKNSCVPCYQECATCKSSQNCEECVSLNAYPGDLFGCYCKTGYYNTTQLLYQDSCKPCGNFCYSCKVENQCEKCLYDSNDLTLSGKCIQLCWKNRIFGCVECKSLCLECDSELKCLTCKENSSLFNGECLCKNGYKNINDSCQVSYFYGNLSADNENKIYISFTEPVKDSLTSKDINISIENVVYDVFLKEVNLSYYNITPIGLEDLEKELKFNLSITRNKTYGLFGSVLFNHNFNGTLSPKFNNTDSVRQAIISITHIVVSASAGIAIITNPSGLWSILNNIQLIGFMPLNSIPYPQELTITSASLLDYNIIPNALTFFCTSSATSPPYKEAQRFNIETSVFPLNTGSLVMVFLYSLADVGFTFLISAIFSNSEAIQKYKQKRKYNVLLRFWIEGYLEIGIYACVQARSTIVSEYEGYAYMCFGVLLCFLVAFSPFVLFVTMTNSIEKVRNEDFFRLYAVLYEEFKNNSGYLSTIYYPAFLLRRLVYIVTQVFLNEYPIVQAYSNVFFALVMVVYLIFYRPFKERLVLISQFLGEACVLIVFTSVSFFLFTSDDYYISLLSNICIYTIIGTMALQFLINCILFFICVKDLWTEYQVERAKDFVKHYHKQQGSYPTEVVSK